MTITVRKRKTSRGIAKLYLDIYNPSAIKKRTTHSLDLFLYDNPKGTQKKSNRETLEAAERIRAKQLIDLAYKNNSLGELSKKDQSNVMFVEYFKQLADKRFNSKNNYGNWDSVWKHLLKFCPNDLPINQVDVLFLENFKSYLMDEARTKSNKKLSQNTLHSYFNKVKASLRQAHQEEHILKNPAQQIKGFKPGEVQREFLTFEELQKLVKADCEVEILKDAFLFSCLTGLRWSDIQNLKWKDLIYSKDKEYWFIRLRQKKTKGVETLPISNQSYSLLSQRGDSEEQIFKGLRYSAWYNLKLQQWVLKAGITKTITFHCGRHTYATLQLTNGTDIYTVSKLLGHRELKTTQVYAKIIDQKKIDASNAIPNLDI